MSLSFVVVDKKPRYYDVFISFRGADTRSNLVSHLNAALSNAGVNTFLDSAKLRKGGMLEPELKTAIEESQVAIVVFSENYAQSRWCLKELLHIMQCRNTYGQVVIPLFYGVDPSVVRKQTGNFGEALKVTARQNEDRLSKWKTALTEVSNLSGWDANNIRNEAELVKDIVENILKQLDNSLLSITEFPIGLESHVQQITKFIDGQSSKVCMIGIWGMGGSGKTTTAKAIYNQIHRRFKGRTSFIGSIREVCDNNSKEIIHLQEQLLSDVLKIQQNIHSIALGITKIETRFRGQKAFVVLDDVTNSEQLKALCANPKLFGPGSVLIITTRDARLLNSLNADHVFTMTEMDKNQSLELLSWHAFRQSSPREDFSELSRNVVAYCGGLPLALEVLGSYLSERTEQQWRDALSKLEKIPNHHVQQKLRISYDGLEDHTLKDIFLDICCFFIGKNRADVTEILNGCGLHADIGIAVLIERSLVKVEKNNKLRVHDLLRDMGRAIIGESSPKEPAKHSRLWYHEDVLNVLSKETGTKTVEGLILKLQRTAKFRFETNAFQEMKKLRLLKLDGVHLIGDYGLISNQLRWVDWQRSNFNFIPNDFEQGNLVVLELKYSNVKHVWQETKLLEKLKVLNLSHSKYLRSTPDFSKLPNLEKLIMKDCPSLSEVHSSIGDLKNLLLINLKDCTNLSNLPGEIYQLTSVKTLILSGCSKIDKLDEDILQMESLTTLVATNSGVKQVPYSILETASQLPLISNLRLRSLVIGMGSSQIVIDTLGKSLSQGLSTNDSIASSLPGNNYPSWLAYTCEGPSVYFQVPEDSDCGMKGITLCVIYSSTLKNMATECLASVLIINYTKFTIQIYKRDTVISFNDEDWKSVVSNLEVGDNVEIFVAFGHGLTVKETAVYLIYGQSTAMEIEPSVTVEVEPILEVEAQLSLDVKTEPLPGVEAQLSPDVKTEPSSGVEAQPSSDVKTESPLMVKTEPSPKANEKIFVRLAKSFGVCCCLNQSPKLRS
ncbi:hypothetical protein TSUD_354860 [Trifolium subterraneum]|uniref:ADP-ribosyl cyclase/cyclic ADP-ribose hydrolase n=1 Tax=Trifolium subterraneum TaxID=3900 RepID=A0A2Z6MFZ4_TRISU|nr:hypothetical protein TSUD_354860 [Trifolium subterraneum]